MPPPPPSQIPQQKVSMLYNGKELPYLSLRKSSKPSPKLSQISSIVPNFVNYTKKPLTIPDTFQRKPVLQTTPESYEQSVQRFVRNFTPTGIARASHYLDMMFRLPPLNEDSKTHMMQLMGDEKVESDSSPLGVTLNEIEFLKHVLDPTLIRTLEQIHRNGSSSVPGGSTGAVNTNNFAVSGGNFTGGNFGGGSSIGGNFSGGFNWTETHA